jgi:regulator of RNase E activity RraA
MEANFDVFSPASPACGGQLLRTDWVGTRWFESEEQTDHVVPVHAEMTLERTTYMARAPLLKEEGLDALRQFDTCIIANAIETFNLRLRNVGFTDASIKCMFPDAPPMVGYAVTARMRSGEPPIVGRTFHDRADLWNRILEIPSPRILVLQDMDNPPGRGAFVGDMHAAILKALGCIGFMTNGSVRELPSVQAMGFHFFAGSVAVSHAYSHIFDFGASVTLGGTQISTGDLLHGDRHGVLTVPAEIAAVLPEVAARLREKEGEVIDFCRSSDFSVTGLGETLKKVGL